MHTAIAMMMDGGGGDTRIYVVMRHGKARD